MKSLRRFLAGLNVRENPEERVTYQVMELQCIRFKGIQLGDIVPNDDISQAIDTCIEGYLWLYQKGYLLEKSLTDKLADDEEKNYYITLGQAFSTFNKFMQTHMRLTE